MSKKLLNIESIKNELKGASLYFSKPASPPHPSIEPPVPTEHIQPPETEPVPEIKARKTRNTVVINATKEPKHSRERINEPTNERTNVKTVHRTKIRHTFDIFADQLLSLREIALDQEKMYGERVLLGDLAQQALDMLIAKEKNK